MHHGAVHQDKSGRDQFLRLAARASQTPLDQSAIQAAAGQLVGPPAEAPGG
jgi:hypothetical protein